MKTANLFTIGSFFDVRKEGNTAKDVVLSLQDIQDTALIKLLQMRIRLEELYEQIEQRNLLISDLQYAQRIARIEEAN